MEKNAKNGNKIQWIDVAKGIAIIFVVLGHCVSGQTFIWVYSFHIPLFFFISGYLSINSMGLGWKEYTLKKATRILWPYLTFWIICIICNYLFAVVRGEQYIWYIQRLGTFLISKRNGIWDTVSLWFLTALFVSEMYFYFMKRVIKNDWILGGLIVAIGLYACTHFNSIASTKPLPWSTDVALFQTIFYYSGYLLSKNKGKKLLEQAFPFVVIIGGGLSGSLFFDDNVFGLFRQVIISYEFTYVLFAFSGIAFWIAVAKGLSDNRLLAFVGQNSIVIMGIHVEFCFALIDLILSKYAIHFPVPNLKGLIMTALTLAIAIPLIKFINQYASWIVVCPINIRKKRNK